MLRRVKITNNYVAYIEHELSLGGILSQSIKKSSLIKQGSVSTFIPDNFYSLDTLDYNESLEFITGENVTEEFNQKLLDYIYIFLEKNKGSIGVFETMWKKSDPISSKRKVHYFTIGDRKYDYVKRGDPKALVDDCIRDARGYPTVMVFIDIEESGLSLDMHTEYPEEFASVLVSVVESIAIGAFDGEGYLFLEINN